MKKLELIGNILTVLAMLLFCLLITFSIIYLPIKIPRVIKHNKQNIGKEIVIRNDTLQIIDYSFPNGYLLDNGIYYSPSALKPINKK